MEALKLGHFTNEDHGTGVSVFLFDKPSTAAYCLSGSSPATRELHTLEFESNVPQINGLVFSGGSAFGLGAADGVMQWLKKQGHGYQTPYGLVPIVPAVSLFDLSVKTALPPTTDEAYQACAAATVNNFRCGAIGAAAGATVGKLIPDATRMKGGFGCAQISLANGVTVLAYVAVNCVGDVYDQGKIIAGARTRENTFADCTQHLLSGKSESQVATPNTTLAAVFTNAAFSKIELKRIAKVAVSGFSHAISPVFTRYDGDILFCVSLGEFEISETIIATMAVEAVRQAIVNAVRETNK